MFQNPPPQLFFSFTYSLSLLQARFVVLTLPWTLYSRACSVISQPTVMAFLELAVVFPFLRNYYIRMDDSL